MPSSRARGPRPRRRPPTAARSRRCGSAPTAPGDGGRRGARRAGEGLVVDEYRVGTHRQPTAARRARAAPRRRSRRARAGPDRARRRTARPTACRRPGPAAATRGRGATTAATSAPARPSTPSTTPARDGPALRADLLVQRHRIAPDQRGLQPAQAEAVRVDLVAGGRVGRRHPSDASRDVAVPEAVPEKRGGPFPAQPTEIASRRSRMNGARHHGVQAARAGPPAGPAGRRRRRGRARRRRRATSAPRPGARPAAAAPGAGPSSTAGRSSARAGRRC